MIKIIFVDVDGTLKDELGRIPSSIRDVITAAQKKGIILCLCTGRSIGTIQDDVRKLPIANIIAGGGNYIELNGSVVYQDSFTESDVTTFLAEESTMNCAIALESNQIIFMNKKAEDIFLTMNKKYVSDMTLEEKQYYQENEKLVYKDNIHEFDPYCYPIHKICVWCDLKTFSDIAKHIRNYKVVQKSAWGNMYYHELVKVGCDKGSAVNKVLGLLSITKEESMCFGNGRNDIDMFESCALSIAMADSDEELKHYANHVCEKASDDGILKELIRREII